MANVYRIKTNSADVEIKPNEEHNKQILIHIGSPIIKKWVRYIVDSCGKDYIAAIVNKMLLFVEERNVETQGAMVNIVNKRKEQKSLLKKTKKNKKVKENAELDGGITEKTFDIYPKGFPIWTYSYITQLFGGLMKEDLVGEHAEELYNQLRSLSPHGVMAASGRIPPDVENISTPKEFGLIQYQDIGKLPYEYPKGSGVKFNFMIRMQLHFPLGSEMEMNGFNYAELVELYGWYVTKEYPIKTELNNMWNSLGELYMLFREVVLEKLVSTGKFTMGEM